MLSHQASRTRDFFELCSIWPEDLLTSKTSQSHDPRNHETPFCSKQSTKSGSHGKFFNFHLEVSYWSEMLSGIRNDVSRKPLTTGAYCSRKCRTDWTSMVIKQPGQLFLQLFLSWAEMFSGSRQFAMAFMSEEPASLDSISNKISQTNSLYPISLGTEIPKSRALWTFWQLI